MCKKKKKDFCLEKKKIDIFQDVRDENWTSIEFIFPIGWIFSCHQAFRLAYNAAMVAYINKDGNMNWKTYRSLYVFKKAGW